MEMFGRSITTFTMCLWNFLYLENFSCSRTTSHDGNLEAGHKHDWEGVTIVFARDPAANGDDWWYRAVSDTYPHAL